MDNFNNVNISVDEILLQQKKVNESKNKFKHNSFDVNNYLQARLGKDETTKKIFIRLLPSTPEGGSPFVKVHIHNVRVNEKVAPSGWKKFPCPIKNDLGHKCPFCEIASEAREQKKNAVTETERKALNELEMANTTREFWIARCIERGHEDEGVKFWLFPHSKKGDGIYDKIYTIFENRYLRGKELGKYNNIFDLNEGKDLCLTLTKDSRGNTVINIADDEDKTPLSTNFELAQSWVNDSKKWYELYTVKPYDYMAIASHGGKPVFSKELGKYVDKEELDKIKEEEIDRNLDKPKVDLSIPTSVPNQETIVNETVNQKSELSSVFVNNSSYDFSNDEDEDDGLPF